MLTTLSEHPESGKGKPLFFEAESKWFGAPQADWATYMDACLGI